MPAHPITWSPKARITYYKILEYLEENWTTKELTAFIKEQNIELLIFWDNRQDPAKLKLK